MTSVKIVLGAAVAAFLALNVLGTAAMFGGMNVLERAGQFTERFTEAREDGLGGEEEGEEFGGERWNSDSRESDFGDSDFGAPGFVGGPPPAGFSEGKGKGGKGVWEMAYAVERANISAGEAEEIALGEVSGRIVETKLKGKDGFPHYEIEVFDGEGGLHEVLVGAADGEVVERKLEDPEDSYKIGYLLDQARIDREEAEEVATDSFPGRVVESKLDDENGFPVWEIETFDENGYLHEVEVNARNGEILAYETKGGA
jgi:uncharacterized membrane protein YkoI